MYRYSLWFSQAGVKPTSNPRKVSSIMRTGAVNELLNVVTTVRGARGFPGATVVCFEHESYRYILE